ncbi:MAG: LysM peptidoglycan-binding domain-containing protein [Deltaproteobacteria bacterium]|nr:LysM peptidoglycan-binding domain-containing protein [Deltaproteobacteria bacterium]
MVTGVLACLLWPQAVMALRYKPQANETLSHISLIHYGSPKKYIYFTSINRISDPDNWPRRILRIPTVWPYRIRKGDDLSKLARKYLKDAERADFLAWQNHIKDPRDIEPGTLIHIPFLIKHKASKTDTMIKVAKRYYWSTRQTGLLRKFNNKRNNKLKEGEIVWVPIYDQQAHTDRVRERLKQYQEKELKAAEEARKRAQRLAADKKRDPDTKPGDSVEKPGDGAKPDAAGDGKPDEPEDRRPDEKTDDAGSDASSGDLDNPPDEPPDLEAILGDASPTTRSSSGLNIRLIREATELYRDGEYELARANLERALESGDLAKEDEADAREVLAFCLVALDRNKEAEHEFVRLLMVVPDRKLDPVTTSPKILGVFERAMGGR